MNRVVTVALGAGLVLVIGCGTQNYEYRLEHTIDRMKYQKRLDDNLTEASTKGKLEATADLPATPKAMTGPTQTFQLAVIEPGKFDVESSFIEAEKQNLHVVARVKQAKAPAKKGAPKAEPPRVASSIPRSWSWSRTSMGPMSNSAKFKEEKKARLGPRRRTPTSRFSWT